MKRCLIITFDFWKEDYPSLPLSVASILAKFKESDYINIEHYSYNLKDKIGIKKNEIENNISNHFKKKIFE